jgi:DNA helicase-2/ATP-dependent DNA helicase PcrA
VLRLETNYRSSGTIVAAADAVIANNRLRKERRLVTDNPLGLPLCVLGAADEYAEAIEVVSQIRALRAEWGESVTGNVAVFYRVHSLSRVLEEALRRADVPYVIIGGLSFFERREIKDLLAYLKAAYNQLDDLSVQRIVNVPPRGVGATSLERLQAAASAQRQPLSSMIAAADSVPGVSKRARHGLRQFTELLAAIRAQGATAVQPALEHLLDAVDYLTFVNSLTELENDSREEMVYELLADAQRFDATEAGGLAGYLARVSLLTSEDHGVPPANAVSLLTLHSAKGLEFDSVFMVGLEEQLFPHERSLLSGDEADIEEERRLFYVGVTRAEDELFLTHADRRWRYGNESSSAPSCFLAELPAEHVEFQRVGGEAGGVGGRGGRGRRGSGRRVATRGTRTTPTGSAEASTWLPPDAGGNSRRFDWQRGRAEKDVGVRYDYSDSQEELRLEIGASVQHPEFGRGEIRSVSGRGRDTKAEIDFGSSGTKKVMVAYAGLRPG